MSNEHAATSIGIENLAGSDGFAQCSISIESRHLNTQGAGHGGIIFTLADSAMAIAANSGHRVAVASQASISFVAAASPGDRLMATANQVGGTGKSRIFDVVVKDQNDQLIALFRGTTISIS